MATPFKKGGSLLKFPERKALSRSTVPLRPDKDHRVSQETIEDFYPPIPIEDIDTRALHERVRKDGVDGVIEYLYDTSNLRRDKGNGYYYFDYDDYRTKHPADYVSVKQFNELMNLGLKLELLEDNLIADYPFRFCHREGLPSPYLGENYSFYPMQSNTYHNIPISDAMFEHVLTVLYCLKDEYPEAMLRENEYLYYLDQSKILTLVIGSEVVSPVFFRYTQEVIDAVLMDSFSDVLQEAWGGNLDDGPHWYEWVEGSLPDAYDTTDDLPWEEINIQDQIDNLEAHISETSGGSPPTDDEYELNCWLQNWSSSGPMPTLFPKGMKVGTVGYEEMVFDNLRKKVISFKGSVSEAALVCMIDSGEFENYPILMDILKHNPRSHQSFINETKRVKKTYTLDDMIKGTSYLINKDPLQWYSIEQPSLYETEQRPPTVEKILNQYFARCAERRHKAGIVQPRVISSELHWWATNYKIGAHNGRESEYVKGIRKSISMGSGGNSSRHYNSNNKLKKPGRNVYHFQILPKIFNRNQWEYTPSLVYDQTTSECYSKLYQRNFKVQSTSSLPLYSAIKEAERELVPVIPNRDKREKRKAEEKALLGVTDFAMKRLMARQLLNSRIAEWNDQYLTTQRIKSKVGIERKMQRSEERRSVAHPQVDKEFMAHPDRMRELIDQELLPAAHGTRETTLEDNIKKSLHAKLTSFPRKVINKVKSSFETSKAEEEVVGKIMSDLVHRQSIQSMIEESNNMSMEDILHQPNVVFAKSEKHSGLYLPDESLRSPETIKVIKTKQGDLKIATS